MHADKREMKQKECEMSGTGGWKLWMLAAVLAGGMGALSACNPPASTSNNPAAGNTPQPSTSDVRLGCTIPTFGHPFFVAMKKGLDEEAAAQGATINVVDGKDSSQEQLTAINNFVVQEVNAIILCPTETDTLVPGVEKSNAAKIPVLTVNRRVDGGEVVSYVGADDKDGGRQQGRALMEALPSGGSIILLQGILGSSPQRDREAGLEEVLKDHPKYKIVQKIPYDFQRRTAVEKMQTVLLQYPKGKLDVIVAQSDDGALAAADECAKRGRPEIKIIGFNGESDAFDYIRQGKMYATILQDAETQGREAVKAMVMHLKGEKVPNPQYTPLITITKENVDKEKPAWESTSS
jgi:ribose transport system substrate-binding protein